MKSNGTFANSRKPRKSSGRADSTRAFFIAGERARIDLNKPPGIARENEPVALSAVTTWNCCTACIALDDAATRAPRRVR